ncbi:MAG: hypothetical protein K0S78_4431 [Thermomicrobiales bacterium]|nr:hypothetical protein [Thermomicrobiales bacterium]
MDAGQLRQEVSGLLTDPEFRELDRLDLLLTDCAATTLLGGPEAAHETEPQICALLRRGRQLAAERRQLDELMQALRALRDRVVGPGSTLT